MPSCLLRTGKARSEGKMEKGNRRVLEQQVGCRADGEGMCGFTFDAVWVDCNQHHDVWISRILFSGKRKFGTLV